MRRTIIAIVALLGLAGIWPAGALASPLLSGYGGPGQGNQAILGSALLNGRGGGGGGGSGAAPTVATSGGAQLATPSGATGSTHGAAPAGSGAGRHSATSQGGGSRSAPAAPASAADVYAALERATSRPSAFLGLSGDDLVYILLGLGVLAFTGIVTSRVARGGGAGERTG